MFVSSRNRLDIRDPCAPVACCRGAVSGPAFSQGIKNFQGFPHDQGLFPQHQFVTASLKV